MSNERVGIILFIGEEDRVVTALGTLIHDANGQPFADQIMSGDPILLPLPQRLALDPQRLELIQEREAGRPAIYPHRMTLAVQ
jgi:hypothetical protein